MKLKLSLWRFISLATVIILLISSCEKKQKVSLTTLLNEMTDKQLLADYPGPDYSLKQFSSYDRRSISPDSSGWFANADYTMFIKQEEINGRREFVLFDHKGPGAIVRWWMTFAGEGSYNGTLRVYLDNSEEPLIEDQVLKVLSGQLLSGEPLSASVSPQSDYHTRGHNLYLPLPYSKRCRITYECDSIKEVNNRWKPSVYYNINYRDYEDDTKVETLTWEILDNNKDLINEVNGILAGQPELKGNKSSTSGTIKPEEKISLEIKGSNQALSYIKLKLNSGNLNQALRSTIVEISFDGTQTVWVPAGDFFGTGFSLNEYSTWFTSVSADTIMTAAWIMPFRKEAIISLVNLNDQSVDVSLEAGRIPWRWNKNSLYFGASWHEYNRIQTAGSEYTGGTGKHIDVNYIDISGKGVYIGDAITVFNTVDAWWGEGDEKIFVDGESFPSSIGTGTEDYYGYAWCRPEEFSHPFIAQPSGKGNFHPGMTVNLRYRALDKIPFRESISSNIELWHWLPATINYALTSYYYIEPSAGININPDPATASLKVPQKVEDLLPGNR